MSKHHGKGETQSCSPRTSTGHEDGTGTPGNPTPPKLTPSMYPPLTCPNLLCRISHLPPPLFASFYHLALPLSILRCSPFECRKKIPDSRRCAVLLPTHHPDQPPGLLLDGLLLRAPILHEWPSQICASPCKHTHPDVQGRIPVFVLLL